MYISLGLFNKYRDEDIIRCIQCGSQLVRLDGKDRNLNQMYECSDCGKKFSEHHFQFFVGMRVPGNIIELALVLHIRLNCSVQKIQEIFGSIDFKVSNVSIYNWIRKYADDYRKLSINPNEMPNLIWKTDINSIVVNGKNVWLVRDKNKEIRAIQTS
jgi:transposase-like protein